MAIDNAAEPQVTGTGPFNYTWTFSSALTNPIFNIQSLGSNSIRVRYTFTDQSNAPLNFYVRKTGDWETFTQYTDNTLEGQEGNGSIQFIGTPTQIKMAATYLIGNTVEVQTTIQLVGACPTPTATGFPGGVGTDIVQWYKADAGLFTDVAGTLPAANGNDINLWKNQVWNFFNIQDSPGGAPTLTAPSPVTNFHPSMVFSRAQNDYLVKTGRILPATASFSIISVGLLQSTGNGFYTVAAFGDDANDPSMEFNTDAGVPYFDPWLDGSSPNSNHTTFPMTNNLTHLLGITGTNNTADNVVKLGDGRSVASTMEIQSSNGNNYLNFWLGSNGGSEQYNGTINELIVYRRALTGNDLMKVQSYLAAKWGLTIDSDPISATINYDYQSSSGTITWPGSSVAAYQPYHRDLTIIGRDDLSLLNQLKSKSINTSAFLTLEMPGAFASDQQFVAVGSTAGATSFTTPSTGIPTGFDMVRNWKVKETGAVGPVNVSIPASSVPIARTAAQFLYATTSPDGTFDNTDTHTLMTLNGSDYTGAVDFNDGDFMTFTVTDSPLPVTLSKFDGKKEGTVAVLNWSTTEEKNSDHFEIHRSGNGRSWDPIGTVLANKESDKTLNYTFTDNTPVPEKNYYRLKMIDQDGTFAFSSIVTINFGEFAESMVYPNPASDVVELSGVGKISKVSVFDLGGKLILKPNVRQNKISVKSLNEGLYVISVERTDGTTQSSRMLIKK